jgi:hypothetical protein
VTRLHSVCDLDEASVKITVTDTDSLPAAYLTIVLSFSRMRAMPVINCSETALSTEDGRLRKTSKAIESWSRNLGYVARPSDRRAFCLSIDRRHTSSQISKHNLSKAVTARSISRIL